MTKSQRDRGQIADRIAFAARTLRIDLLDRKIDRLAGGEMRRVSISRAIVREPHVVLMNEPLSNLGAKLREAMRTKLKARQMRIGMTFLFVTHGQVKAMTTWPHRTAWPPARDLPHPPQHLCRGLCRLARDQPAGRHGSASAPVAALVHDVENHGTEQVVTLRVGAALLRASVSAQMVMRVAEQVRFGWTADRVMVFDRHSGLNIGRSG